MTSEDKRYVWYIIILLSFCIALLVGLLTSTLDRKYTNKAIIRERIQTHEYVDSVFNTEVVPRLDTIIYYLEP